MITSRADLGLIQKDYKSLYKDLSQIISAITVKSKELETLKLEIESMEKTAVEVRKSKEPLIKNLDDAIQDRETKKVELEKDILSLTTSKQSVSLEIERISKSFLKRKKDMEDKEISHLDRIVQLNKVIDGLGQLTVILKQEASEIENKIKFLVGKLSDVTQLNSDRDALINEIELLKLEKPKWDKMVEDIEKHRVEVDERDEESERLYNEVKMIHSRLRSEYIKFFKEYNNL